MIKYLIVNADDFGLTGELSRAIVEAHRNGIVSSTTLLGNCADELLEQAHELSLQNPNLGIGAHLVLTTRRPIIEGHKTLVDGYGNFKRPGHIVDDELSLDEVYAEWKAQLNRLSSCINLTHLDSHHHVHLKRRLFPVAQRLSKEFNLPMRSRREKKPFEVKADLGFYGDQISVSYIKGVLEHQKGLIELMVHPGYQDDVFLQEISSYVQPRQQELAILTSDEVKELIRASGVQLVNYSHVKNNL